MEKIFIHEDDLDRLANMGRGYFGGGLVTGNWDALAQSGEVMITTSPLAPGIYDFDLFLEDEKNSIVGSYYIELVDGDGETVVQKYKFGNAMYKTDRISLRSVKIKNHQAIRLVSGSSTSRYVSCMLSWTRVFPLEKGD